VIQDLAPRCDMLAGRLRSVFVSDTHLGYRFARATAFLHFLETVRTERLYVVGDFVDGRRLMRNWRWSEIDHTIVSRLVQMAHRGTRILYTPGNHDAFAHQIPWCPDGVEIEDEFVHTTKAGRRLLVAHGDRFCHVEQELGHLARPVEVGYDLLLAANPLAAALEGGALHGSRPRRTENPRSGPFGPNEGRAAERAELGRTSARRIGIEPHVEPASPSDESASGTGDAVPPDHARFRRPLSSRVKGRLQQLTGYLPGFEQRLAAHAAERGFDGVVCGHVHAPSLKFIGETLYANAGDWVEHCTALVEDGSGQLRLLDLGATAPVTLPLAFEGAA